jgi:hypothetical protein
MGRIFLGLLCAFSRFLALNDQAQWHPITTRHNIHRHPALVAGAVANTVTVPTEVWINKPANSDEKTR